jgi:peptide/nickel transport system substrate-binding protein
MVAAGVLIGGLSAGCASEDAGAGSSSAGEFVLGLPAGPQGWDPYDCSGGTRSMLTSVYDTLMRITPDGGVEPALATEWKYETPTRFTMTLRDGVEFDDGTPLDAAVVKANLERAASAPTGATAQFVEGEPRITVTSDLELTIELAHPDPDLPDLFSDCAGMIVHPDLAGDPDRLASEVHATGPYTFDSDASIADSSYVFIRKDDYWNAEAYPFEKAIFKIIPDSNALLSALLSGEVDISVAGSFQAVPQVEAAGKAYVYGNTSQYAILLNDRDGTVVPALKDQRVRQALNYAIDRQAIMETFFGDKGIPTPQLTAEGTTGYDAGLDDHFPYDPGKAKALLAEAGYPNGFSMTVLTSKIVGLDSFVSAVADYWAKIGVEVNQHVADTSTFFTDLTTTEYAAVAYPIKGVSTYSLLGRFFGPTTSFSPFGSTDAEFADLMNDAATGDDNALRDAAARLLDLGWYVGVGFSAQYYFYDPAKVTGLEMRRGDGMPLFYDWRPPTS